MFFYLYKKTVKKLQFEKNVTKDKAKADMYMFRHAYKSIYVTHLLMNYFYSLTIALILVFIGMSSISIGDKLHNLFFIIIGLILNMFAGFILLINYRINNKIEQGKNLEELQEELIYKINNIYRINPLVISYNNWRKLRKVSKTNYKKLRNVESIGICYEATFYIANILKNKHIKIMWVLNNESGDKYGHAILVRKKYIYDTNRKKTYSKSKYLEYNNSEIYKEFGIDEYLYKDREELIRRGINNQLVHIQLEKDWQKFKVFCEDNGGKRCVNDEL